MTTNLEGNMKPNNMPKRPNPIRQRIVGDLIHTLPTSWTRKTLGKSGDGKEVIEETKVKHLSLRFPLAQNVSDENVERIARRFL